MRQSETAEQKTGNHDARQRPPENVKCEPLVHAIFLSFGLKAARIERDRQVRVPYASIAFFCTVCL
jgi:hypothetical protein